MRSPARHSAARRQRILGIVVFITVLAVVAQAARSDDPYAAAARAYIDRCTPDLVSQGMPSQKAQTACSCAFSGIAAAVQFGVPGDRERYERLMQAEPNPNGTAEDRQLYDVLSRCFAH